MKLRSLCVALCCGLVLFAACTKKNNDPAQRTMLLAGKWQLTASTATTNYMGKDTTLDFYIAMDICEKDDVMTFAGNGTAAMDEGANKCSWDNQIETATWVLLDNNTKIAIADSNPDTMGLDISNTQLKLTLTKPNSSGTPVTYISTYKNIK